MPADIGKALDAILRTLERAGIPTALIGASALAVHGLSRSTADIDLLICDTRVLERDFWRALGPDVMVDVRRGDANDPLAGVVRAASSDGRDVDLVVAKGAWARDVIGRAEIHGAFPVRTARAADLVLLKLYAGGSQDRWDIEQLLAAGDRSALVAEIDGHVSALPSAARALWAALRPPSEPPDS